MKEQGEKNQAFFFFPPYPSEASEFCETFKRPVASLPAFTTPLGNWRVGLLDSLAFPEAAYQLLSPS